MRKGHRILPKTLRIIPQLSNKIPPLKLPKTHKLWIILRTNNHKTEKMIQPLVMIRLLIILKQNRIHLQIIPHHPKQIKLMKRVPFLNNKTKAKTKHKTQIPLRKNHNKMKQKLKLIKKMINKLRRQTIYPIKIPQVK